MTIHPSNIEHPDALPPAAYVVETTVVAVLPEYGQVKAMSADGRMFAITKASVGDVPVETLAEGQKVVCTVAISLPRVESFAIRYEDA